MVLRDSFRHWGADLGLQPGWALSVYFAYMQVGAGPTAHLLLPTEAVGLERAR